MKRIFIICQLIASFLGNTVRKLFGTRLQTSMLSLVSLGASIKTRDKGKIIINYRTCISATAQLTASEDGILSMGKCCFVNRGCVIAAHNQIIIDDNVTIGPGTYIYDHDHDRQGNYKSKPIAISKNVWIGANCTLLKGICIGENSVIAAGTTVSKDVPANVVYREKKEYDMVLLK